MEDTLARDIAAAKSPLTRGSINAPALSDKDRAVMADWEDEEIVIYYRSCMFHRDVATAQVFESELMHRGFKYIPFTPVIGMLG